MAAHIDPEFIPPDKPLAPTLGRGVFVDPLSDLIGDVRLGDAVNVWGGCILRGDIAPVIIGAGSNIQDMVLCHVGNNEPCIVGEDVAVGHKAVLHGCRIGDGCLIGIGAIVLSRAIIGEESIVAAGALVPEGFEAPPRSMIMGLPAKIRRELTPEEARLGRNIAAKYRQIAAARQQGLYRTLREVLADDDIPY